MKINAKGQRDRVRDKGQDRGRHLSLRLQGECAKVLMYAAGGEQSGQQGRSGSEGNSRRGSTDERRQVT